MGDAGVRCETRATDQYNRKVSLRRQSFWHMRKTSTTGLQLAPASKCCFVVHGHTAHRSGSGSERGAVTPCRQVAVCRTDQFELNRWLVENGLAVAYR